jgi:hypothetical protein
MAKYKMDPIRNGEEVIHDLTPHWETHNIEADGEVKGHGLIPRPWAQHPVGSYASSKATKIDIPVIDQSEWSERVKDKIAAKSQLSDIRLRANNGQPIPSRDQNGKGYCWAHSGTTAMLAVRAAANMPYADLSAYAVACIIKSYKDEGGWGAQGVDFQTERGIPTSEFWPQQSMNRSNDNSKTWENAKLHRWTEGWVDMEAAQYDRNLNFNQVVTCLLVNTPVVVDFNWWGHSVCALDAVPTSGVSLRHPTTGKKAPLKMMLAAFEVTGGWGIRIWNSWGDSWSDRGMGVLTGNKAIPDGSVAPRVAIAS